MPASTTINATGGTISNTVVNGWTIRTHTFTSSGSFVVTGAGASDVIEYIVVGGGGGGTFNNYVGSGGGGAEVKYANSVVTNSTYTITVGAGGTAKAMGSYGGGGAGGSSNIAGGITIGALGGPGSGMNGNPDATGTYTYGTSTAYAGAGAGGAGQAGQGSNGGNGKLITTGIFSTNTTYYGGGGAGGLASASGLTTLSGGLGGGANATLSGGQPATPNSGGGGAGGSQNQGTPASDGATGVVRISYYVAPALGLYANVSNVTAGNSVVFTYYSANATGNVPYTISGVTSAQISNASLTGNFVLSAGTASLTLTTIRSIISATISISADVYTANANITYPVAFSTSVGRPANTLFSTASAATVKSSVMDRVAIGATTGALLDTTNNQKTLLNTTRTTSKAGSTALAATSSALLDPNTVQKTVSTANINAQTGGILGPRSDTITTQSGGVLNTYVVQPGGSKQPQEYWL